MLRSIFFLYFYFVLLILSHHLNEEFLLCKKCGQEIAYVKDITYKKSPHSLKSWNDTNFLHNHGNRDLTFVPTIQLLTNGDEYVFKLITVAKANMYLVNETTSIEDTWFPNFSWTIGVCPHCFAHIGWYFESVNDAEGFFGLVMDSLFDESHAEELIMQPKLKLF